MTTRIRLVAGLCLMAVGLFPVISLAADNAYDNAASSAYNPDWNNGSNGGGGFGAWTLSTTGSAGRFIGNSASNGGGSGDINTSGEAFGMWANSGGLSEAIRNFNGTALQQGQSFYIRMDNGFIQTGGTVGLGLQNSSGSNRIEFFFVGGQSAYKVNNTITSTDTGIGFTADGLRLQFTIAPSNQIRVVVKNNAGSSTLFDQLISVANNADITRFRLFNFNAGSGSSNDAFFNEMAVPEPSSGAMLLLSVWGVGRRRR